jgi:hypothetical protein
LTNGPTIVTVFKPLKARGAAPVTNAANYRKQEVNVAEGEVSPAQKKAAHDALREIEAANEKFRSNIQTIKDPGIHSAHQDLDLKVKALRATVDERTFKAQAPSLG